MYALLSCGKENVHKYYLPEMRVKRKYKAGIHFRQRKGEDMRKPSVTSFELKAKIVSRIKYSTLYCIIWQNKKILTTVATEAI